MSEPTPAIGQIHSSRIQVTDVYRNAGRVLQRCDRVDEKPDHDQYMITKNGLLVFGKCRNGMEFEVTYTRGSEPIHRKITIANNTPFVRLVDL